MNENVILIIAIIVGNILILPIALLIVGEDTRKSVYHWLFGLHKDHITYHDAVGERFYECKKCGHYWNTNSR